MIGGSSSIVYGLGTINGSVLGGGAITVSFGGILVVGGGAIVVEGVIGGTAQVTYGGIILAASAKNFGNDLNNLRKYTGNTKASTSKDITKVDAKYLSKNGIDAHELKYDVLGKKASIAQYDIYLEKSTG